MFSDFLVKFNEDGERLWGTYCGLNPSNNLSQNTAAVSIDPEGNPYLSGTTSLQENIGTPGSYQPDKANNYDCYIVKFNPDGERQWGTYYGGPFDEYNNGAIFSGDSFYLFGSSSSGTGIATPNALQPNLLLTGQTELNMNIFIAKFNPAPLSVTQNYSQPLSIYPNPNHGIFNIPMTSDENSSVEIYNMVGQKVLDAAVSDHAAVHAEHLSAGIYFVRVKSGGLAFKTEKIVIE